MQQAIGTGTWPGRFEPDVILDYCEADVDALARLLSAMLPRIDLPRALLRGRYMAAALMEHYGVPIDVGMLARLRHEWTA
jgi:DNA polymerase I